MGTNYYWINPEGESDDVEIHIGKISSAGRYCHPCGSTFNPLGTHNLHSGEVKQCEVCPICGGKGAHTNSMTWTMMKHRVTLLGHRFNELPVVVDEYGRKYTAEEFLTLVQEGCRIEFQSPCRFS